MLTAAGFKIDWQRDGHVHMSKEGKAVGFPIDRTIPKKQVMAIARNKAGWNVEQFNEIFHSIPATKIRAIGKSSA